MSTHTELGPVRVSPVLPAAQDSADYTRSDYGVLPCLPQLRKGRAGLGTESSLFTVLEQHDEIDCCFQIGSNGIMAVKGYKFGLIHN